MALIILTAAIIVIVFWFYYMIKFAFFLQTDSKISPFTFLSAIDKELIFKKLKSKYHNILMENHFDYYLNLNDETKNEFLKRVQSFLLKKDFVGKEGHFVTLEQKILISATAIKLSFGLDKYIIPHFSIINIYPKVYFSKISKQYHKGDINLNGIVNLSYEDFLGGYSDPEDGINLGIHEMAHAFNFDRLMLNSENDYFSEYYKRWFKIAKEEMSNMLHQQVHFFRKYASNNIHEFFAVSLENFFERPQIFQTEMPALYRKISLMLNQDPLQKEDPRIRKIEPKPLKKTDPINLLFKSEIDLLKLMPLWFYSLAYLVLSGFFIHSGNWGMIFFTIPIMITYTIMTLSAYKQFFVYENGLKIESYYFKKLNPIFLKFESIFSIQFGKKNSPIVILKHFENNTIKSKKCSWMSSEEDCKMLIQKLLDKEVRVQILQDSSVN